MEEPAIYKRITPTQYKHFVIQFSQTTDQNYVITFQSPYKIWQIVLVKKF